MTQEQLGVSDYATISIVRAQQPDPHTQDDPDVEITSIPDDEPDADADEAESPRNDPVPEDQ